MKVLFSFGLGKLHFTNLIPALAKRERLIIDIVQGWVPGKLPAWQAALLNRMLKRQYIENGLGKRKKLDAVVRNNYSIPLPEFLQRFFWLFFKGGAIRNYINYWTWNLFGWFSARKLTSDYDVCHIRSGAGAHIINKAKRLGVPVVVDHSIMHPAEIEENMNPINNKYNLLRDISENSPFWQQVMKDATASDVILVNSELVKDSLVRKGMDVDKIKVAVLGINSVFWELKHNYETGTDKAITIVFTGSFGIRKGADDVIAALELLKEQNIDVVLEHFGAVSLPDVLMERAKNVNINFNGFVPQENLTAQLAAADIYLFPSLAEGAANSLLEAMAAGLPAITTEFSGGPVRHLENAWVVDIYRPDQIAEAIAELAKNEALRERLGQAAAKTIQEEGYTWEKCAVKIENMYVRLKEGKQKGE